MAAEILHGLVMNGHNRHFLIPVKTNTCWDVMAGTADDATVRMAWFHPRRARSALRCLNSGRPGYPNHRCARARARPADLTE